MSKHTPGPWHIIGEDEPVPGVPALMIEQDCRKPKSICAVDSSLDDDDDEFYISDEDYANAKLIAAAPDLLATLVLTEKLLTKMSQTWDLSGPKHANVLTCVVAIRKEIEKATS